MERWENTGANQIQKRGPGKILQMRWEKAKIHVALGREFIVRQIWCHILALPHKVHDLQ
jgi:hypothetical protein